MENLKLKYGEWALITGASSGIGKEFAFRLASQGINLILVARRKDLLEKLSAILKLEYGIEVIIAAIDLSENNFLEKLIESTGSKEVSILINNAGIGRPGEYKNSDPEYESRMIKLNCLAPGVLTNYFGKKMIVKGKGAIIFLGSIVAFQPTPLMATYSATKAFNLYLGNALWPELKKYGVDVLTVNPGNTSTEFERMVLNDNSPLTRNAGQVVDTALRSLGKRPNIVDGLINKFLTLLSRLGPLRLIVAVTGLITRKLYRINFAENN